MYSFILDGAQNVKNIVSFLGTQRENVARSAIKDSEE
jgi:hypothetical protein